MAHTSTLELPEVPFGELGGEGVVPGGEGMKDDPLPGVPDDELPELSPLEEEGADGFFSLFDWLETRLSQSAKPLARQ